MNTKILFFIIISMFCFSQIEAQTATKPWAIGLHAGNSQYSGDWGNSLFDFDPFQGFVGLSVSRRLNSAFDLDFRLQKGRHGHWKDDNIQNSFLTDQWNYGLAAHYKFLGDATFKPYLKAGLAYSSYSAVDNRGIDDSNFAIPLGLGFDYAITDALSFNVQTLYGLNFGDKYDNNVLEDGNDNYFHHSIGFKLNFGSAGDRDGDGISDKNDKCPDVAGPKLTMGCPDTDLDGIIDSEDFCPTIMGTSDNNGCPQIEIAHIEVMQEALYGIYFDTEKSTIKSESYPILNKVASIMNNNEYYKLSVDGYTDSDGDAAFNQTLSQQRADAVKSYLISKGISGSRITAKGYGEKNPVATNITKEGKALNRRVEFTLSY